MSELAPYAARPETSRGRMHVEPEPRYRTPYQRDRDRVVHCSAFRRLEYKTQVFVNHEGDMFRTRLTHSLEVSQIGRTVARALNLNEDLTEAICLAHDLGHTPFGHAGQDALNECMREFGGFEHNLQSLRVVDVLEEKYAEFPGLNLTFETREGILKHCSKAQASSLGEVGRRFLEGTKPGLEAQVANIADEIAYNNHDVDDGLRADLLNMEELSDCSLFGEQARTVSASWPDLTPRTAIYEIIRRMIDLLVTDLVNHSSALLAEHAPGSADDVRQAGCALVNLSDEVQARHLELKRYLNRNLYRHYRVQRMSFKAEKIIKALFAVFTDNPRLLPPDMQDKLADSSEQQRARIIADYIAGMTDRYAIAEYERLTDPRETT